MVNVDIKDQIIAHLNQKVCMKSTTRYAIKDYHQVISLAILATLTDKSYVGEQRPAGRPGLKRGKSNSCFRATAAVR